MDVATVAEPTAPGAAGDPDPTPEEPTQLAGGWRKVAAVGVLVVVAVGLVLRFWTRSDLWLDEALTVDIARRPLSQLHHLLRQDGAPPLYYVLLHFWMKVFGTSNEGVRSLSGVISVVTLPLAWLAGRRYGRASAWAVLVLVATAPFAIYYGTEARMYSLVMLLTVLGFLGLDRAMHRATAWNLVAVAVVTAALLYTQYWALYLVATLAVWLLWQGRKGQPDAARRTNARWSFGALIVGCIAFVPWLPTFFFQSRHTGTPWAAAGNFGAIVERAHRVHRQPGHALDRGLQPGAPAGRHLPDPRLPRGVRGGEGSLAHRPRPAHQAAFAGLDLRRVRHPRDRGGRWPLDQERLLQPLRVGRLHPVPHPCGDGAHDPARPAARAGILAVAAVAGLAVGAQNVDTQRTQASPVAAVLAHQARPGDIIAYCPDQLGPAVYRLTASRGYHQITYPRSESPAIIDWVDYKSAIERVSPTSFVHEIQALAGSEHQIWLVWATGYQGYGTRCETIATELLQSPGYGGRTWVTQRPGKYYEPMDLTQYKKLSTTPGS